MADTLRELVREAEAEAYSPRAKRCWFPWQHEWTMWDRKRYSSTIVSDVYQVRRCVRCGVRKEKWI